MLDAALWGLLASSSLLLGAVVGLRVRLSTRVHGLLLGFGAGALISAVGVELALDGLEQGSMTTLAAGLGLGGAVFVAGNLALERRTGRRGRVADGASLAAGALALGALLDGIPESAAIGLGLAQGDEVSVALVGAVFLSNFPESVGAAHDAREAGQSPGAVVRLWLLIVLACTLACVAGRELLTGGGEPVALVQGVAAGGILAMLADTMMPEAYEHGGRAAGLVTVLGFAIALALGQTS